MTSTESTHISVEAGTQFLYQTHFNEYSGRIEISIYDPERWDGKGGARFGFGAEVLIAERSFGREGFTAEVSQGSIGAHTPEEGRLRVNVYLQACEVAAWINRCIADGQTLATIYTDLSERVPTEPTSNQFKVS